MKEEWIWAAAIAATPFVLFGLFEIVAVFRRRRHLALARRPKDVPARDEAPKDVRPRRSRQTAGRSA